MAYFRTCPLCGAALDPGEHCDCEDIFLKEMREAENRLAFREEEGGQLCITEDTLRLAS